MPIRLDLRTYIGVSIVHISIFSFLSLSSYKLVKLIKGLYVCTVVTWTRDLLQSNF